MWSIIANIVPSCNIPPEVFERLEVMSSYAGEGGLVMGMKCEFAIHPFDLL